MNCRRRRRRLHRLARRGTLRPRIQRLIVSITETDKPGELGFALALAHQTSYGMREQGKDWTGNSVYLWAIAAPSTCRCSGPQGFREVGELIICAQRTTRRSGSAEVKGVNVRLRPAASSRNSSSTSTARAGRVARDQQGALREHGIFGGKDLSADFPALGQSALYCRDRNPHRGGHRPACRRAEGGRGMTDASANITGPLERAGGDGARRRPAAAGQLFAAPETGVATPSARPPTWCPPAMRRKAPPGAAGDDGARHAAPLPAACRSRCWAWSASASSAPAP